MTRLWIIGAGGHAKVVAEAAQAAAYEVQGFLDDSPSLAGSKLLNWPVLGDTQAETLQSLGVDLAVIAIGDNQVRKSVAERLSKVVAWATVTHPTSVISPSCRLGEGSVVFAGAIIQADSQLGRHVILNTQSHLDHDGKLDDFVHLCPGAALAGNVEVGEGSMLGTGCAVLPGVRIGAWAKLGAGSSLGKSLDDHCTGIGVPARILRPTPTPDSA